MTGIELVFTLLGVSWTVSQIFRVIDRIEGVR